MISASAKTDLASVGAEPTKLGMLGADAITTRQRGGLAPSHHA